MKQHTTTLAYDRDQVATLVKAELRKRAEWQIKVNKDGGMRKCENCEKMLQINFKYENTAKINKCGNKDNMTYLPR